MKINYFFKKQYIEALRNTNEIFRLESVIDEPHGNLVFESLQSSTKDIEIEPEMFFWWLDRVTGQFKNEEFQEYDEDISGLIYHLNWKADIVTVYYNELNEKKVIFKDNIKRTELTALFQKLSKDLQKEIEDINPLICKTKTWNSYYFVKHYCQGNKDF